MRNLLDESSVTQRLDGDCLTGSLPIPNRHYAHARAKFKIGDWAEYRKADIFDVNNGSVEPFPAGETCQTPAGTEKCTMIDDAGPPGKVVQAIIEWAHGCDDIRAVALVGSHARNAARPGSDIDLVLLVLDPMEYFKGSNWLEAIDWQSVGLRPLHFRDAR